MKMSKRSEKKEYCLRERGAYARKFKDSNVIGITELKSPLDLYNMSLEGLKTKHTR